MDTNFTQLLHSQQEIRDQTDAFYDRVDIQIEDFTSLVSDVQAEFQDVRGTANAAEATADAASVTSDAALQVASGIASTAQQALDNSTEALNTANAIDGKASTALANSADAVVSANTALITANTAQSTANAIDGKATSALSTANATASTVAGVVVDGAVPDAKVKTWSGRTQEERNKDQVSLHDFSGTFGEKLNNAIDYLYNQGGGIVNIPAGSFEADRTIIPKRGVTCKGVCGQTIIKLANGVNSPLVESYLFDELYAQQAYQVSHNQGYTQDYGFEGIVLDCNGANQVTQNYGVKMYGRRLILNQVIITNSKGVGLWTAHRGERLGPYTFEQTKTGAGNIGELEIVNSREESWIFEGPSDQFIGHVVTNVCGDESNDGTTPQKSTHFPNQEVHSLRVETAFSCESLNLNNALFGRGLYVARFQRAMITQCISNGSWGQVLIEENAWGCIENLVTQANRRIYNGVAHPSLVNNSNKFRFPSNTFLRTANGLDQQSAPLVQDNAGGIWGTSLNRQALSDGGVFFEVNASYINIGKVTAIGAGTVLKTNQSCNSVDFDIAFNGCGLVWENLSSSIKGNWSALGRLNVDQNFAVGVIDGANTNKASLSRANFSINNNGVWQHNNFVGSVSFDPTINTPQTVTINHEMWRAPRIEEINSSLRISGFTTFPQGIDYWVNSFNATSVVVRVQVGVAAVGDGTGQIAVRVN